MLGLRYSLTYIVVHFLIFVTLIALASCNMLDLFNISESRRDDINFSTILLEYHITKSGVWQSWAIRPCSTWKLRQNGGHRFLCVSLRCRCNRSVSSFIKHQQWRPDQIYTSDQSCHRLRHGTAGAWSTNKTKFADWCLTDLLSSRDEQ